MAHLTGWFVSEEVTGHNHEAYEQSANNPDLYIEAEGYGTIAEVGGGSLVDRRDHARLITAAPELLEKCEYILSIVELMPKPRLGDWNWPEIADDLRESIAKAKGLPK